MTMKAKFLGLLCLALAFGHSGQTSAGPVSQVDRITLGGPTYQGDQWTLNLLGPVTATVTYITTVADVAGCNICNVTAHWGAAINADPGMSSFLTASYLVWDEVSPYDSVINLTANTPGISFTATVSVTEASDNDFNETEPLTVSIVTVADASLHVPEPATAFILGLALVIAASARYRR